MQNKQDKIKIVCGDPFLRREWRKEFLSSFDISVGADRIVELTDPDVDEIKRELFSPSLFSSRKIVCIYDLANKKEIVRILERFADGESNEESCLLLIDEDNIRRGKSLAKNLSESSLYDFPRCSKPKEAKTFVDARSRSLGMEIDADAISLMVDLVGNDYLCLHSEIEKLHVLFGKQRLTKQHVFFVVESMSSEVDFLSVYLSLMSGDNANAVRAARSIISDAGHEAMFSCIMKLVEVALICLINGNNSTKGRKFATKTRPDIVGRNRKILTSTDMSFGKQEKPPSAFVYRVGAKISGRFSSTEQIMGLFLRCYDSFAKNRAEPNESLASAQIDEIICVMCGR